MHYDWIFVLVYLLAQLFLAIYVTKFIKNEKDLFLGGRTIPVFVLSFSIFATWFGAETCIGSSGAVFEQGLSGSKAEPFGYAMCLLLTALVIAPRIWNARYTTYGDFVKDRYGPSTEMVSIWIMVPSSIIWGAAQVRAFGELISSVSPVSIGTGIAIAATFVVCYNFVGGFLADVITDLIHGLILGLALMAILYFTFRHMGGVIPALSSIPHERLSFVSEGQSFWKRMDTWAIPIMGSLIAQELVARVLAAKGPRQAKVSGLYGCGLYLLFGSVPILLGLLGPYFHLNLDDREQFLPALAKTVLPSALYLLFSGALISAILSTIDSILLANSALISHNLLIPRLGITEPRKKILCARVVIALIGIICYFLAVGSDSIYKMVETASSFGTAGVLIVTMVGLFSKKGNPLVANTTLIMGLVYTVIFRYLIKVEAPFLLTVLAVTVTFIVTNLAVKAKISLPKLDQSDELVVGK
ncbi:MAG: sodium:solute symporter family protein [Pseudomonadota bacterium]